MDLNWMIGAVGLAALVLGITEALKEFGIQGKASRAVVLVVGILFVGFAYANEQALIPEDWWKWVKLVVVAIAGGLSAMGYYDFSKKRSNK